MIGQFRLGASAFVALCLASAGSAAAADDLCKRLDEFEKAELPKNDEKARWIELHWKGRWLDFDAGWGLACSTSGDDASQKLCDYVLENTSYEFASRFPEKILDCHGYRVPTGMANWRAEIDVSMVEDRWHRLVVDLGEREGDSGAVRYISVSDETAGGNDVEYLPIEPLGDGVLRE